MKGRRLEDAPIGSFPLPYDELQPGDYWFVTVREDHPEYPRRLNVKDSADDRGWWGNYDDPRYAGNLTGLVLSVIDPLGHFGTLSIHTVREEADGTVSVRAGDGSSNSIKITRRDDEPHWHGYIEHGEWNSA